jgi:hypothetical protein
MPTSRSSLLAGCIGRTVLTTAAATVGGTLVGVLCGVLHAALRWNDGLIPWWVDRFAIAGLIAGFIVGVCVACDHVVNFAAAGDGRPKERPRYWGESGDWPPLPAAKPVLPPPPHEDTGHALTAPRSHRWT